MTFSVPKISAFLKFHEKCEKMIFIHKKYTKFCKKIKNRFLTKFFKENLPANVFLHSKQSPMCPEWKKWLHQSFLILDGELKRLWFEIWSLYCNYWCPTRSAVDWAKFQSMLNIWPKSNRKIISKLLTFFGFLGLLKNLLKQDFCIHFCIFRLTLNI